jgi:hypothetical protein
MHRCGPVSAAARAHRPGIAEDTARSDGLTRGRVAVRGTRPRRSRRWPRAAAAEHRSRAPRRAVSSARERHTEREDLMTSAFDLVTPRSADIDQAGRMSAHAPANAGRQPFRRMPRHPLGRLSGRPLPPMRSCPPHGRNGGGCFRAKPAKRIRAACVSGAMGGLSHGLGFQTPSPARPIRALPAVEG